MNQKKRYYHKFLGFNYRTIVMQAALGLIQLKKLNKILDRKKKIKNQYLSFLKSKNYEVFPKIENSSAVEWFVTIMSIKKNLRDKFIAYMLKNKIECRPMIFPVSFAEHFKKKYNKKEFTNSYKISLNSIHLPSSLNLELKNIEFISNLINKWNMKI